MKIIVLRCQHLYKIMLPHVKSCYPPEIARRTPWRSHLRGVLGFRAYNVSVFGPKQNEMLNFLKFHIFELFCMKTLTKCHQKTVSMCFLDLCHARSHKIIISVGKKIDFVSNLGVPESRRLFARLMIET